MAPPAARPAVVRDDRSLIAEAHPIIPPAPLAVTVFLDSSVPGALESLEAHAESLAQVAPVGLILGDGGAVTDRLDEDTLTIARRHGVPAFAVLQNVDEKGEGWRPDRVARLSADRAARRRLSANLVALCHRYGLAGIHLDLEELDAVGADVLDRIAADAAAALHAGGYSLAVDVPADWSASRLKTLSRVADEVVVMAYDENDDEGAPGPIASEHFVADAIATAGSVPITLGLGIYGYDWVGDQPGDPVSFVDAHAAAREAGVTPSFDAASGNTRVQFADEEGAHEIWLLDAASLWNQLARRGPVTRVALWRIGGEDPGVWAVIEAHRSGRAVPAGGAPLATVAADTRVDNLGDGPFLSLSLGRAPGQREIEVGAGSDGVLRIVAERWRRSPTPWVVRRAGIVPGKVALTFDDGPDPRTTPRILDQLHSAGVPATFFVVGLQAERSPDLVRRAFAEGHTIGNHTFTHPDVDRVPGTRLAIELEATSRLLESLLGRRPLLYRPPSLVDIEPRTPASAEAFARAGALGYLVVDADVDPRDWEPSTPAELAERTLAAATRGGVILLHDGGGDRSTTAEALPAILDGLKLRGLEIVPLAQLVAKSRDDVMPAAIARPAVAVTVDRAVFAGAEVGLRWASRCLLAALFVALVRGLLLLGAALAAARRRHARPRPNAGPLPSITVVIPAYNERDVIARNVSSVLTSDVPVRVIVVDDGSTDGTAEHVAQRFGDDERVTLLVRRNGGKADALRAGFARAGSEVVVALDGDTLFAPDTVRLLVEPMRDRLVGAVAGNAEVGNRENALTALQAQEYLVQQEIERRAFDLAGALPVVPGAIGAWRRRAVAEVGGFSSATLAEDADLAMALCRAGWRVVHAPEARARTEAPETLRALVKQRVRWSFGTLQAMWKHRGALVERRAGAFGRVVLPLLIISQVAMPLMTPLAVAGAALAIAAGHLGPALLASALLGALEVAQLLAARCLMHATGPDRSQRVSLPAELALLILGRLLYRPLLFFVLLRSLARVLDGIPLGWNKLARRGSVTAFERVAA